MATVLAALRRFQEALEGGGGVEAMPHFAAISPLTSAEVDDLCVRINLSEAP